MSLPPANTCAFEMHGSMPIADYANLFQTAMPVRDLSEPFTGKILKNGPKPPKEAAIQSPSG